MLKPKFLISALAVSAILIGCDTVTYVNSELTGSAKPGGGISEVIPPTKTYTTSPVVLRRATLDLLNEQGYIYEENLTSGLIKTEPKTIVTGNSSSFIGAYYQAKLFIKLDGSNITHRATFDKRSKLTTDVVTNIEFPEKENEMRKAFFTALEKKLPPAN